MTSFNSIISFKHIIIYIIRMSLNQYTQRVEDFVQRIKISFELQEDTQNLIFHRKIAFGWIQEQLNKLKEDKEKFINSGGLQGLLNLAGFNTTQIKKMQSNEKILLKLKESFKKQVLQFQQIDLAELSPPQQIFNSFTFLQKKKYPDHFGVASSPLMKSCFIKNKQGYDKCITNGTINQFKCVNFGSDTALVIKYQRYLVEHLFNRLLNNDSELTTVLKIEIQHKNIDKTIEIFCCVEDLANKPTSYKALSGLSVCEATSNVYLEEDNQKLFLDETNLFHAFMTQLFIVPIQTVVSDYVLIRNKQEKSLNIKKMHSDEVFDIFFYMKEHPSLRNPLTYFYEFVKNHKFEIQTLKKILSPKQLYANFYEILSILFKFLQNDFTVKHNEIRTQSLCISEAVFTVLWAIFQQFIILSDWLSQVISPIKSSVTLSQIKNKLEPIYNELTKPSEIKYEQYKTYMLNLPIENYLSINVSKINIQKYKDRYIHINWIQPFIFINKKEIYNSIFTKTLQNYDIRNTNIYESINFLNFIAINHTAIYEDPINAVVHPSWKLKAIWKQIVQLKNNELDTFHYIGISLDLLAFSFDFDPIEQSTHPFESIKNDIDETRLLQATKWLHKLLRQKYEKKSDKYLSFLIEKSFKYKKYQIAKYLIESGIHIKNYQDIFAHAKQATTHASIMARKDQKSKLIEIMKAQEPEMFRRYQWQELIHVKLKAQHCQNQTAALLTIGKGVFSLKRNVYECLTSKNFMDNTLSRKDYMFCNNRRVAKISIQDIGAYAELTQYPLLRYFYSFFLKELDKNSLSLNFCGFFSQAGSLFHLVQCIPQCFNFEKGLQIHTEQELKNYLNEDDLSQAIIISMILMPTNVQLKNIILTPLSAKDEYKNDRRRSLFIVDFHDFYQKNGFELDGDNVVLKVKNSLFLFSQMENAITTKLLKKYSQIDVIQIINKVFKKCSNFISETNKIRPRKQQSQRQLYSLIFQNGYATALAERMFKIKTTFEKKLRNKISIDHLQLLQIINPQLRYYYEQVMRSSHMLIDREKIMLDDSFKTSFIITDKLISFHAQGHQLETVLDSFPRHYMRLNFQGPSENLKHMHQQALKFNVFNEKIIDLKQCSHSTIEYYIRHIDLSCYEKPQREELFNKIQQYSLEYLNKQNHCLPLSVIRIANMQGLREKHLKFSDERLKDMIFEDVSISEGEFNSLIRKYQNMSHLYLDRVAGIKTIGELIINIAGTLEIKNLKTLTITNCPNIEMVDLKCDQLQNLTLRNNSCLTRIFVNSHKLKRMDCSKCTKLHLQNIGIYIFRKIDVLLSKNSCDGDVKKLQDKSYSIFLTRILAYLCNRFQESDKYKLELVVTLIKLQLLEEKFYSFGNAKMSINLASNLLSFITKARTETLKKTQQQIVKLFLKNELVQVLSIDELSKVHMDSLRIIINCIKEATVIKEFKEIIFRQIIQSPQNFHQHLNLIITLFESLQVQKIFAITLTLIPEINNSYYSNLIILINQKQNLQKLQITIENSIIEFQFLQLIFNLSDKKNKISKLTFTNCQISISRNVNIECQPTMKELHLYGCKCASLTFIQKFSNMTAISMNSCTINNLISPFYSSLGKLEQVKSVSLINIKEHIFEKNLQLPVLFEQFQKLKNLKQLDFSSNKMNLQQLLFFSKNINTLKLYQLTLNDFYQPEISDYIENFLYHEHLRIIHIEFKIKENTEVMESFLNQLATNKTIIKLKIKTDHQIISDFFKKIKQNTTLEQIYSNQSIPNWLKNHIANNSQNTKNVNCQEEPYQILGNHSTHKQDFYRIGLSLDGGGVRGLLLATELDYICRNVGQPLHKIFDCIGGTSIGGILALASTGTLDGQHPVCNTQDLMNIFQLYGTQIFKKSQIRQITNLFDTKYDVTSFEDLLYAYFKDARLSQTLQGTNVVVTAVNRLNNEDMIFKSIHAILDRNKDFYMRDIGRATSAAPIYFPSAEIKNVNATQKYSLLDGGVGLNNPSKLVIDDVIKITQNEATKNNYFLLSLGTGKPKSQVIPTNAGLINISPIIDSFTQSANFFIEKDLTENYKGHYLRVSPIINVNRKDAQLDDTRPEVLKLYKEAGLEAAEEEFSNKIAFGKFKNQSFIEWLRENTARKYDI